MENSTRCFVACSVGEEVRRSASRILEELSGIRADFKWVRPESLHVTLKFLGNVASDKIDSVCAALREISCEAAPFSVEFRGIRAFPGFRNPQVVWAGVTEGAQELGFLAQRVDEALGTLSFPRETRRFTPHVTLGRRRSARGIDELCKLMATLRDRPLGRNEIREVLLMKSTLRPEGAVYQCLASFPLGISDGE